MKDIRLKFSPRFSLGRCYITQGINCLVEQHNLPVIEYLSRHQSGDWGELDKHDIEANEQAIKEGYRLLSAYSFETRSNDKIKIWIITEADRSSTTLLLPEEY